MKALVYRGPHDTEIEDVAEPEATADDVVVAVEAVGICGSDITAYLGHMDTARPGDVRGHEFAGRVVSARGDAERWIGLPVAVNPILSCGSCRWCATGADNLCPQTAIIGVHRAGAYAELVQVPAHRLLAFPADVPLTSAATAEPLAQAVHDVHLALKDGPVETALVVGAGAIGFFVLQAARNLGIPHVVVLEPDAGRRADALAAGAQAAYASAEEADEDLRGNEVDVVLDAVGTDATRRQALAWTRQGGTVVLVGLHADESALPWRDAIRREITLRGSMAETSDDFRLATSWLAEGRAGLPRTAAPVPLTDGGQAFADVVSGRRPELRTFLTGL